MTFKAYWICWAMFFATGLLVAIEHWGGAVVTGGAGLLIAVDQICYAIRYRGERN